MFERYTEKARNAIFSARFEASQYGAASIETDHLLLGLLQSDEALARRFLHSKESIDGIRKQIDAQTAIREKTPISVDLPLSHECKRVLAGTAEEADGMKQWNIGTEHLLLGVLREEQCGAARLLQERGLRLAAVRNEIARGNSAEAAGA